MMNKKDASINFWIGVASKDHVSEGVRLGI